LDTHTEHVEVLTKLGLSPNEAKIFIALSRNGESTAKAIAKTTGTAREVVYRTMLKLHEKSLVEEVLMSPKVFKARPIKETFECLLQRKEEENKNLRKKAESTLKEQQTPINRMAENQTIIIPPRVGGKDINWRREWHAVRKSVDIIMSVNKFIQWTQATAETCICRVINRNVKMRVLTEKQIKEILIKATVSNPTLADKLPHIEFKSVEKLPLTEMTIFDKKTLFTTIHNEEQMEKMSWLCTNNPLIVEIANYYFENLWDTTKNSK